MEKGKLVEWVKAEGDKVEVGDVIASCETDKATMDIESLEDAYLARILVGAGSDVKVGTPIAVMVEEKDSVQLIANADAAEFMQVTTEAPVEPKQIRKDTTTDTPPPIKVAPVSTDAKPTALQSKSSTPEETIVSDMKLSNTTSRIYISPYAKKLLKQNEIGISGNMKGSGPGGKIIMRDVDKIIESIKSS